MFAWQGWERGIDEDDIAAMQLGATDATGLTKKQQYYLDKVKAKLAEVHFLYGHGEQGSIDTADLVASNVVRRSAAKETSAAMAVHCIPDITFKPSTITTFGITCTMLARA